MNQIDAYPKELPKETIPYFYKNCLIERIYDGDTVTLELDLGFGIKSENVTFRLFGLNAPEVRGKEKEQGKITRDWLRNKICHPETEFDRWGYITSGPNSFIDLQTIKTSKKRQAKGSFGRYLCILWHENKNINWQMIDEGLADIANY